MENNIGMLNIKILDVGQDSFGPNMVVEWTTKQLCSPILASRIAKRASAAYFIQTTA